MAPDILRDSVFGFIINKLSGGKILPFPEEKRDFVVPEMYLVKQNSDEKTFIVDWYGPEDPANPKNWSIYKKSWIVFQISFLTIVMYMASSIFVSGSSQMMKDLNTSRVKATLPLTTYLLGFGFAPMILSPMSEHAPIGRSIIYVTAIAFFCVIQVPTALVHTIEKIIGLRLLAGIASAPSLAIGGATIGDTVSLRHVPYAIVFWSAGAIGGPALGPFIGSLFAALVNWRWNFWFLCIISGACLLAYALFLPETSRGTILHRRALRLRKLTGNPLIQSPYEVHEKTTFKKLVIEIFWRPIFLIICEPIVFCIDFYMAFIYVIFNSWFEALPICFVEIYNFTTIEMGTVYFAVIVGGYLAAIVYLFIIPRINNSKNPTIEKFLLPAIFGSFFLPIGLFIFSWSSSPHTHWMGPIMSIGIFTFGAFFIFQSLFSYFGKGFHRYLASVFAGNALLRSILAAVFPLFTPPMYHNLAIKRYPVAWGGTIWACVGTLLIAIPFFLYNFGVQLRGRSKYAN
ncbi:uncharacterized protein SAPINGB_P006048 [Magnusiomyces paraingens]|uniref:Major facilitator superfamily (MFS) profile domain-containing protein n=1 Tax=Magnusiomyces paraingens TaxID=2606893 RepID=A0A5E8C454_9ASCO|nr:uncharacterized protein SAPINGB_P006048 [Saprochaete ingens]VVT58122.1 unnamed protein product [Saprochaete ingens]